MSAILVDEAALAEGFAHLCALCPVMDRLSQQGVVPPMRRREPGFTGLAAIIVAQQLSVASARAIWAKVEVGLSPLSPVSVANASDEAMRACGLSAPKIRTLRAIARAALEEGLDFSALETMPPDEAHARLVTIKGVGPWTADIYLLFCLGQADAFPAGDLALQEAARIAYGLPERPDVKTFTAFAERWRPWRGVAAKTLWAYYAVAKSREGVAT